MWNVLYFAIPERGLRAVLASNAKAHIPLQVLPAEDTPTLRAKVAPDAGLTIYIHASALGICVISGGEGVLQT